jgi:integrase
MNESQIEDFEKLQPSSPEHELYKNMFKFVINGIGLRISDILTLKWTHIDIKNGTINKVSYKTGKTLNVRIPAPAMEIIKNLRTPECSPNDYVFPILNDSLEDLTNPEILDDAISRETSSYNKYLRSCGKKIGLSFNLSSHKGRHTYATKALSKGLELHYVQHTLGHQSIKETEIYAKIVKKSVNEAVDKYLSN